MIEVASSHQKHQQAQSNWKKATVTETETTGVRSSRSTSHLVLLLALLSKGMSLLQSLL